MKMQKYFSNQIEFFRSTKKAHKGNLLLGTCTLHYTDEGYNSKAAKHLIIPSKKNQGFSSKLITELTTIYDGAKKKSTFQWLPVKVPRLDFFFCDLMDPFVKTWINVLSKLPRSPLIKRIVLFHIPPTPSKSKNSRKITSIIKQVKQFTDVSMEYPSPHPLPTTSTPVQDNTRKPITSAVNLISQIIHILSSSGPINISFQDFINLFSSSQRGIVLSIKSRGKTITKTLQKALKYPYLIPLKSIKKTLISLSGTDYTLKNVIDLLKICQIQFHRKSQNQWGVSHIDPTQSSFTTGQMILFGTTD